MLRTLRASKAQLIIVSYSFGSTLIEPNHGLRITGRGSGFVCHDTAAAYTPDMVRMPDPTNLPACDQPYGILVSQHTIRGFQRLFQVPIDMSKDLMHHWRFM